MSRIRAKTRIPRNVRQKNFVSAGQGFPKQMLMTHRYVQNDTLVTSGGATDSQTYSLNGMYDPDISGIGHQPMLYDNMLLMYQHYCVIGSKITVKIVPQSASSAAFAANYATQIHSNASPLYVDPIAVSEQTQAKLKLIPPSDRFAPITITQKWSAKKYFGKSVLANSELQGAAGTNPTEQSYFTVSVRPVDLVSTNSYYIQTIIEYIAIWKEVKEVAQS